MSLPVAADLASIRRGAAGRMSGRLTQPFAAGGDALHLALTPVAGAPQSADVVPYDFSDHAARFGSAPVPSYVVRSLQDLDRETRVTVRVADAALPGGAADATLTFAAGTLAGESSPVVLPSGSSDAAQLTRITVTRRSGPGFAAAAGQTAREWAVTALLGTLARVFWVLGGERDLLRRQIARTATQRQLSTAVGDSLDLIGVDLAVPRFPPLPYSVDDDTVALYHIDDAPGAAIGAEDFTGRFPGRTPHHGTPSGSITLGAPGRYGPAVAFTGPGAVTVASNAVFDVVASADLTAECFVKPEASTPDARVLARRGATGAGWSIEVGEFGRGLARAVRATVSDGTAELVLNGDLTLATDRFTHLAVVLDRSEDSVALWVDGVRADMQDAGSLGAPTAAVPLVIGPGGGTTLRAAVDEVRISRTARAGFAPVLGESDEHYRRRLRIFQRWVLPTPAGLTAVLNDAVGAIAGVADPVVVDDTDAPITRGSLMVRVVPTAIAPGETMDGYGRRGVSEDEVFGEPDDRDIPPALLQRYDRGDVDFGPAGSGDAHLMQPSLARALDRLVTLVAAEAPAAKLRITTAWSPGAPDARASGRGVTLTHPSLPDHRLAALAHRAGCGLVSTLRANAGVYAASAQGGSVALGQQGADPFAELPSIDAGSSITLTATPTPPAGAEVAWSVATGGPGRVRVTPAAPGTAAVEGLSAGLAVISLDVTYAGFPATASASVRVVPTSVAVGSSIAADGTLGAGPEAAGDPAPQFDPALLVTVSDPRATYVGQSGRMQRGTARRFLALLDDLAGAMPGTLTVSGGFTPAQAGSPPTLASQGRALTLRHSAIPTDQLAVFAHIAGFSLVSVFANRIEVLHQAEDPIDVTGPDLVEEGSAIGLHVEPDPSTVSATTRLSWSSGPLPPTSGQADVTTTSLPAIQLIGRRAGYVWVQAAFREAGANGPYAMQVRLSTAVPAAATITRDQYDLVMNVVHALHPLGVEVLTRSIRPAVVELAGSPSVDPDYTYPKFRLHRSAPRLRKDAEHG